MTSLPIIDLRQYTDGASVQRRKLAARVDRMCREIGFLAITGHDISADLTDNIWRSSWDFFDLPLAQKLETQPPHRGYPHGYFCQQIESLARSRGDPSPPDLKESFNIGPPDPPANPGDHPDLDFYFAPNLWPRRPSGMRAAWVDYYRAMSALGARVMSLFAAALKMPEDYFDASIDQAVSALRALNYPPSPAPPASGQLRAGAHTDYGSLTILLTDSTPGLEVLTPGGWLPVVAPAGALIVNLGDLMARWTNDRWVSTLHRVVNPRPGRQGSRRQSIAFFHNPNFDAAITCIPSCLAPGDEPKYPPVYAGPYLMERFQRSVGAIA